MMLIQTDALSALLYLLDGPCACPPTSQSLTSPHPYALQAKNLVWRDLDASQLELVRHPHPKQGVSGREHLARFNGLSSDPGDVKSAISLDLYTNTLRFGEVPYACVYGGCTPCMHV